jgi:ABC-type transport system involved in multi-copper enzyme maturation permease subunit
MLWYKAWLETRSRFLVSLIGIMFICCLFVFLQERQAIRFATESYYYYVLYSGYQFLALLWVVAVTLLMMGGLLREKAAGASSFTLALPVSRSRLMRTRIAMGLIEAVTLGIVSVTAIFLTACVTGKPLSIGQPALYLVLLFSGGAAFFGIAVLAASLVEGEYTAPLIGLGALIGLAVLFSDNKLRHYSLWQLLMGGNLLDRKTSLISGPLPWPLILASVSIAAVLLLVSVKLIERREF